MITFLIFIAVLAVLVLSHEFGHFIIARGSGMKVYEFGFGFPPRILGIQWQKNSNGEKKWKLVWGKGKQMVSDGLESGLPLPSEAEEGTLYSLNLIPLGGFVQIKGENGEEVGPDSFSAQSFWKRAATLLGGVTMNVVLAFILLSVGLMLGLPQAIDNLPVGVNVKDKHLEITQVMSGKPAALAGIQPGDVVVNVGGMEKPSITEMQNYVNNFKDQDVEITVKRGNERITKKIHPFIYPDTGKGGLGVGLVEAGTVSYPWYKAIYYGFLTTGFYLKEIVLSFYYLIAGLFAGRGAGEALSGPVGIAVMTGQVAKLGFSYLLNFMAVLSLNLAILNILPIPALDGGRLLFLIVSKIKLQSVSQKYEQIAHGVGFAILMILVVVITVKDLGHFKGFFVDLWNRII
ncbi:MAG TPA: RIP metalloprotease RseP [Candidatus Udaeobacter sp.]|nr:RIP metalloprotease RseP [Candidatus Udaeobacter sp.]